MIKLKITREELSFLCRLVNPITVEKTIVNLIKKQSLHELDFYFAMLEIGVNAVKKYQFDVKTNYKISFKYAHATAMLAVFASMEANTETTDWMRFIITKWTAEIHQQLTNYQPKYYGGH